MKFMEVDKAAMMGRVVTVLRVFERDRPARNRREWTIEEFEEMRAGWIVGFRTLQNGIYRTGSTFGSPGEYEHESPYLEQTETIPCVLVVFWPNMNPIKVPTDGFIFGGKPKSSSYKWKKRDRELLKDAMKDWPRDNKGRFLSADEESQL